MPVLAATSGEFEARLREHCASATSKFHQLLQLAAFWNPAAMLYVDPDSGSILPTSANDIVARSHSCMFDEWLSLPLRQQFTEFAAYLATLSAEGRQTFLRLLSHPSALDSLVPPLVSFEARMLFTSDLNVLAAMVADT